MYKSYLAVCVTVTSVTPVPWSFSSIYNDQKHHSVVCANHPHSCPQPVPMFSWTYFFVWLLNPQTNTLFHSVIIILSASCILGIEKIDPLNFLTRCRKRQLNQTLSVLSLSTGFLTLLFIRASLCVMLVCLFMRSVSWLFWLSCQYLPLAWAPTGFLPGDGRWWAEAQRDEVGWVLGQGLQAPPHQLGSLGKRCKLPQRDPGGAPAQIDFCTIFDL